VNGQRATLVATLACGGLAATGWAQQITPAGGAGALFGGDTMPLDARVGVFESARQPKVLGPGVFGTRDLGDTFDSEPIALDAPLTLFAYLADLPGGQSVLADGFFQPAGLHVFNGQLVEAGVAEFDNGDGTFTIVTSTRTAPLTDGFLPLGVTFTGGTPATTLGWLFGAPGPTADRDGNPDSYDPQLAVPFPPLGEFTVVGADIFLFDNGIVVGSGSFSGLPLLNQTELNHFVTVSGAAGSGIDEVSVQYLVEDAAAPTQLELVPVDDCLAAGETQLVVEIDMSGLQTLGVGGQFFLEYDETLLDFVSADPGDAPFTREIYEDVDEGSGTIDYAVGVPDGGVGTAVPTTMARITFDVLGEFCSVPDLVSFRPGVAPPSRITDAFGTDLGAGLIDMGPVTADVTPPTVTPPSPITQNADAGGCDAAVTVPSLIATDNCGVDSIVNDFTGTDDASAVYPQGTTTVSWTVTDVCGNQTVVTQDITIEPENGFTVDVELAATDPGPFDRCITFEFTPAGGGSNVVVEETLTFTNGIASATIEIPCGDYSCVTARDTRHTLRKTDNDNFADTGVLYAAEFLNGPGDDDSLIGGNLNDDSFIDILDFGVFIAASGTSPGADSPCGTPAPHADINGDGVVDTADFTFIQINFLDAHEFDCGGSLLQSGDHGLAAIDPSRPAEPVTSVSVDTLSDLGLAHLAAADLNADGTIDQSDIGAFFAGARPDHLADLNGDGVVDELDLQAVVAAFRAGDPAGDVNHDGRLDLADLIFVAQRLGTVIGA